MSFINNGTTSYRTGDGETLRIDPWGANSVRVRSTISGHIKDTEWALLPPSTSGHDVHVKVNDTLATLTNGNITVTPYAHTFNDDGVGHIRHTCSLEFRNAQGTSCFASLQTAERSNYAPATICRGPAVPSTSPPTSSPHAMKSSTAWASTSRTSRISKAASSLSSPTATHKPQSPSLCRARLRIPLAQLAIGRATFGRNRTEWMVELPITSSTTGSPPPLPRARSPALTRTPPATLP